MMSLQFDKEREDDAESRVICKIHKVSIKGMTDKKAVTFLETGIIKSP